MANKDINNITLPVFKRVEELRHTIEELKNNDLELQEDIILQEDKAIKSGDNSIVVNSENDEIVLSGLVRADNDVEIEQDLIVDGDISGANITGNSIIENMSGYSFGVYQKENITTTPIYASAVKNGNKLTLVNFFSIVRTGAVSGENTEIGHFSIPTDVYNKLSPYTISGLENVLSNTQLYVFSTYTTNLSVPFVAYKTGSGIIQLKIYNTDTKLTLNTTYLARIEITFLLSENLVSQE